MSVPAHPMPISALARHPWFVTAAACLATAVLCALAFYLTPLRFWNPIDPPMRDIDPAIVYAQMQADPDQFLFVDVRNAPVYEKEHAVGALNIPIHDLYDDRFVLPRRGKTIVLICGDAKLAGVAYGYLAHYGFQNLVRIEGGMGSWKEAGLPVEGQPPS